MALAPEVRALAVVAGLLALAGMVGAPAARAQDTGPARSVEIEQLSNAMVGRERGPAGPGPMPVAVRGPADSAAANLASGAEARTQGRPQAAAAIGGEDRCDPSAGTKRADCAAVIESRAGEFARAVLPEIPFGLTAGELLQPGQAGAYPGVPAGQAEAATVLGRQGAPAPPAPDPAQQAVANAIIQVIGR